MFDNDEIDAQNREYRSMTLSSKKAITTVDGLLHNGLVDLKCNQNITQENL